MRQFYELVVANFKMTVRNRQSLFWMFLFPVMLMVLFGIGFAGGGGQSQLALGLVDLDKSDISQKVKDGFSDAGIVKVREYERVNTARAELKDGEIDGVVVLRSGMAKKVEGALAVSGRRVAGGVSADGEATGAMPPQPGAAKIDLYFDPSNTFVSDVVRGLVANVLNGIDRAASGAPQLLELESHSVRQRNLRYIDFLVPGIIAMTMMNSAMFGLGGTIVSYRERGILRRLKVTPQPLTIFLSAQITNQLLFSMIRAVLLIVVARLFFDVEVIGSYIVLMAVVLIGSLCFVTIAFTVASFSKNREIADSIGNVITMPMMFLGGVFFPVDSAPAWIQPFIKALPLKYLADATRDVMIKGEGLVSIAPDLMILSVVTVAFFIASALMWRWE